MTDSLDMHNTGRTITIEIAVDNMADADAAIAAGADRLELASDLQMQGLSAPEALVGGLAGRVPVVAMVRPRAGDFCYGDVEFGRMIVEAGRLAGAGAQGIVFGMLTATGRIDRRRVREFVGACGDRAKVFHRAFDFTPDGSEAMEELISLGVTRILTAGSGGWTTGIDGEPLATRIARVRALIEQARGRIEILPGGGVRPDNAVAWLGGTGATQLHSACRATGGVPCGTSARLESSMVAALRREADGFSKGDIS